MMVMVLYSTAFLLRFFFSTDTTISPVAKSYFSFCDLLRILRQTEKSEKSRTFRFCNAIQFSLQHLFEKTVVLYLQGQLR